MESGSRLIEAEQQLAELPELESRLERAEGENERLRAELARVERERADLAGSLSWRLTAPLRGLSAALRRLRRG